MTTISGLFDHYETADEAVRALQAAGFEGDTISVLARNEILQDNLPQDETTPGEVAESSGVGALIGGTAGGLLGLLAGIGAIAIPGLGPVLVAGSLAASLGMAAGGAGVGAAVGGILGAMTALNVPKEEAELYAEGVRRGGILVIVQAPPERVAEAASILGQSGALDTGTLRAELQKEGWDRFDRDEDPS